MANTGGAFLPNEATTYTGAITATGGLTSSGATVLSGTTTLSGTATLTAPTLTTPTLVDPTVTLTAGTGSFGDRVVYTEAFVVGGAALHAAVLTAVTFPAAAVILRAMLNITTVSTGASTVDVGYTATTATTTSDTLLDGIDGNAATGLFDSMNAALAAGANAKAQLAASGKWVTIDEKTGDSTGMVAVLYVQYMLV